MGTRKQHRESNRQAIIDAGLDRILSNPMDMLRHFLNASSLSKDAGMSKDSTYRLFTEKDQASSDVIVREVAEASTRPEWSGFANGANMVAEAFQASVQQEQPFDQAIIAAMAADVEAQFLSPGCPVGWILHAAAITASPEWKGASDLSEEDRLLGEQLLEIRARFYERMTDDLLQLMIASMSLINRRPRRGMDPRQLVALLHSIIDGAVLRRYIQPEAFDSTLIGEAVYALALAFSEAGTLSDPRRPGVAEAESHFDAMLECAALSWDLAPVRTVESTAQEAGVPLDLAHVLFPSVADLADAVVWASVLGGGPLIVNDDLIRSNNLGSGTELAVILGLLRRLRDVADHLPGAIALVQGSAPAVGIGVRAQLEREIAEVLRNHCPGINPLVSATELVGAAFDGRTSWETVTSLMRVLEGSSAGRSNAD